MQSLKIKQYLIYRRTMITLALMMVVLMTIVGSLAAYPIDLLLYVPFVCGMFLIVFCVIDYNRFIVKWKNMTLLINQKEFNSESMFSTENPIEELLQQAIKMQQEQIRDIKSEVISRQNEKSNNLTCWIHQIKTPLAALKLLEEKKQDESKEDCLIECNKIEHYLDMVLQMIRLDEYENDLVFSMVDVDKCVKNTIRKYAKSFILKGIKVEVDVTKQPVLSDEKYLQFILEQICSNALKYTNDGEIRFVMKEDKQLQICDTGIGISEEDLPRIFERGFTGYNGRIEHKATGIGLYLVKRICEKLNHTITITSKVNEGTQVKIDFSRQQRVYD